MEMMKIIRHYTSWRLYNIVAVECMKQLTLCCGFHSSENIPVVPKTPFVERLCSYLALCLSSRFCRFCSQESAHLFVCFIFQDTDISAAFRLVFLGRRATQGNLSDLIQVNLFFFLQEQKPQERDLNQKLVEIGAWG